MNNILLISHNTRKLITEQRLVVTQPLAQVKDSRLSIQQTGKIIQQLFPS